MTYELACLPSLSIRTLLKLAEDYCKTYPIAAAAVRSEMYSDNVFSGAYSLEEALQKQNELIQLFKQANCIRRKWTSNMLAADSIAFFILRNICINFWYRLAA